MPNVQNTTPTTDDLVAAFVANNPITKCEPAAAANANTSNSQTRAVLTKSNDKIKRALQRMNDERDNPPAEKTTRKNATKKRDDAPAQKSTLNAPASNDATISASDLATSLNISPKSLRVILRKHFVKPETGWAFDAKTADEIRAIVNKK